MLPDIFKKKLPDLFLWRQYHGGGTMDTGIHRLSVDLSP